MKKIVRMVAVVLFVAFIFVFTMAAFAGGFYTARGMEQVFLALPSCTEEATRQAEKTLREWLLAEASPASYGYYIFYDAKTRDYYAEVVPEKEEPFILYGLTNSYEPERMTVNELEIRFAEDPLARTIEVWKKHCSEGEVSVP